MFIIQYSSINIKKRGTEKKLLKIQRWGSVEDTRRHLWQRTLRKGSLASSIRDDNCLMNSCRAGGLNDKRGT